MINIKKFDSIDCNTWNEFILNAKNTHFMVLSGMAHRANLHSYRSFIIWSIPVQQKMVHSHSRLYRDFLPGHAAPVLKDIGTENLSIYYKPPSTSQRNSNTSIA